MAVKKELKVALAGNPNSGKSTLFNVLTGLNQKIANFPGITVDKRSGGFTVAGALGMVHVEVTDLPGTYSLYPKSAEERIPFEVLCDMDNESFPDVVVLVADATNLKRSLFFCSQVIDLKIPVVIALNMMDVVRKKNIQIDIPELSQRLGVPVIPVCARKKEGIEALKKAVTDTYDTYRIRSGFIDVSTLAPGLAEAIREITKVTSDYSAFLVASNVGFISYFSKHRQKKDAILSINTHMGFEAGKMQQEETLERYKIISGILQGCLSYAHYNRNKNFSDRIDRILTHKIWGYTFFLGILFLLFQAVFSWSAYPMEWIEKIFLSLEQWTSRTLPPGMVNELIVNGILAGLSGIVVFVPQIALLFAFIAILEDSGYMARISFIMDRLLRQFGLSGKSIIPLMGSVACAVPAIMSTRTIQSRKERIITMMVTPLMSCSARIPVYTLLISIVVPSRYFFGFLNLQGLVLMALYLIGFLAAISVAWGMKRLIKNSNKSYFIMELPVYRMPQWSNVWVTVIEKIKVFLFDAGKIIIAISVILWGLSSYGPGNTFAEIEKKYASPAYRSTSSPSDIAAKINSEKLAASYAGYAGRFMEPFIQPLGFDWKIGISLITSFAAREVFVGTMATLYSVEDTGKDDTRSVRDKMAQAVNPQTGKPLYSMAVAFSLMIFYAFAMQCISTIAVVRRETHTWKWPVIQIAYMGVLAYASSFVVYQVLR